MAGLLTSFFAFVALHSIPAVPSIKERIISWIGRLAYFLTYSAVSTAVLAWLIYEALNTEYVELWAPAAWQIETAFVLAPLGLFLVITGLISANPFSITLRHGASDQGAIVNITRHPVLLGFFFWAVGHMLANGDLRSLILFGGFAVFSLSGIAMAERRAKKRLKSQWSAISRGTTVFPFYGIVTGQRRFRLDRSIFVGFVAAAVISLWLLLGGHGAVIGVDPITSLQALR